MNVEAVAAFRNSKKGVQRDPVDGISENVGQVPDFPGIFTNNIFDCVARLESPLRKAKAATWCVDNNRKLQILLTFYRVTQKIVLLPRSDIAVLSLQHAVFYGFVSFKNSSVTINMKQNVVLHYRAQKRYYNAVDASNQILTSILN